MMSGYIQDYLSLCAITIFVVVASAYLGAL